MAPLGHGLVRSLVCDRLAVVVPHQNDLVIVSQGVVST